LIVVAPTDKEIAAEAEPDATAVPPTVTVAPEEVTVGITVTDATLFGTVEVYDNVPDAKATFRAPSLSTSAVKVLAELSTAERDMLSVYVVVVKSPAVTTTETLFEPTLRLCDDELDPDATALPPTVTVAAASVTCGFNVMLEMLLATVTLYVSVAGTNDKEAWLKVRALRVLTRFPATARVTVTV
jgi:hypothetical protein